MYFSLRLKLNFKKSKQDFSKKKKINFFKNKHNFQKEKIDVSYLQRIKQIPYKN